MTQVKMVLKPGAMAPSPATKGAIGWDLHANIEDPINIMPGDNMLIPTGVSLALPDFGTYIMEAQIRPRSGLSLRKITIPNSPGTIDPDYRGEIKVNLLNGGQSPFKVLPQDRIAQMVFNIVPRVVLMSVETLDETERGAGGFGSTGV